MESNYLESAIKQFEYYKMLGEKTMQQLPPENLSWQYNDESNSIAMIVNHLHGNMLSRWTDFLTSDGEKEWRNRDAEFAEDPITYETIMAKWNEGWKCLFKALSTLTNDELNKTIYIRNMGQTVTDAINRQMMHYAYHVGQIVFIGKMICNEKWTSLSIPKGDSKLYNAEKFAKEKHNAHFTDEYIGDKQVKE